MQDPVPASLTHFDTLTPFVHGIEMTSLRLDHISASCCFPSAYMALLGFWG